MRKLLFLVLTITASVAFASPPVQDEKFADPVVKVPVVEKELTVEHTEAEAGPLVQDEAVADSRLVEPDSVLLEPETTEEQRVPEETQVMLEKPVLEADYLTEEIPETELEPEPEITAIQTDRNMVPVEEAVAELESETNTEVEDENVVKEEPTLEADYITAEDPEIQMEPGRERRRTQIASVAFASPPVQDEKFPDPVVKVPVVEKELTVEHTEAEAGPLVQDEAVADSRLVEPDSVLLEPETTEEQRVPEETQVMLEKPVLEADYLTEEIPETELEPEPEITAIQTDRNMVPVEEAVAELESETNTEVEDENVVKEEPTLEADYITAEDPEIQMEPGRERRRTQIGWWTCRGVVLQGKCYQFFTRHLSAYQAEFHCQSICHNGHLASVTNSYILGEIGKLMDRNGGRTRAWLGGWRIFNTHNFIWLDGTPWSYYGWAAGEPNNAGGQENCVETWYNLAFNDSPCTIPKPFICSCPL